MLSARSRPSRQRKEERLEALKHIHFTELKMTWQQIPFTELPPKTSLLKTFFSIEITAKNVEFFFFSFTISFFLLWRNKVNKHEKNFFSHLFQWHDERKWLVCFSPNVKGTCQNYVIPPWRGRVMLFKMHLFLWGFLLSFLPEKPLWEVQKVFCGGYRTVEEVHKTGSQTGWERGVRKSEL